MKCAARNQREDCISRPAKSATFQIGGWCNASPELCLADKVVDHDEKIVEVEGLREIPVPADLAMARPRLVQQSGVVETRMIGS